MKLPNLFMRTGTEPINGLSNPRLVMLVGWGGNNGSTLTGGVIANKEVSPGPPRTRCSKLTTLVKPEDIVFGGWDISDMNLADAMARAKVFNIDLQKQLRPYMESMVPLPRIYDPDFIAANYW
ncbi:hypothetical protein F3Y22_tig00117016pilonHSYRG00363 [Hibiscus syriacus]|uniref:Inositol-3-phosphate synthase n=1 Tax=Hibiscus syriacus TaxID=106335 RepID=A0A6A2X1Z0_HIBSY|nr:hypothetical protein F3Y22_tig00117016pilonHSYRG00363 [Hibiscus syriacus]